MKKYAKYLFEFIAIFVAISLSFLVEEWREQKQNREETVKAIKMIRRDLRIDTNYYKLRKERLERFASYLEPALDGELPSGDVESFKKVLSGLKGIADYQVKTQGVNYLRNNIRLPSMKNDTLLTQIGFYHDLSSGMGNYQILMKEQAEISGENYHKIFEFNPHFLNPDTSISHKAIRAHMNAFLKDKYWLGRINLTYREAIRTMPLVYDKNERMAIALLQGIEDELDDSVDKYSVRSGKPTDN